MPNAVSPQNPAINVGAAERIGSTVAGTALIFHALARPSSCRRQGSGRDRLRRQFPGERSALVDARHRREGAALTQDSTTLNTPGLA